MSKQRQQQLERARMDGAFDVVVIGGGINGIGTFRDLALQGLRVLLVERNDFCSGCSAAPSRMIHGGLRYLENGEFNLVRESLAERDALLANAPHLVTPLPTIIPVSSIFSGLLNAVATFFGWAGKPSSRGALPIKIGLTVYDWVTRHHRRLPRHHFVGERKLREAWPLLTPAARFAAIYEDAWISHPERLCLELIQQGLQQSETNVALNYAVVETQDGKWWVRDRLTDNRIDIASAAVIHATGAWLDESVGDLTTRTTEPLVSGTKGSHLIIDNQELFDALAGHMVYFENTDGRVCIAFPYLGKVLAGATDILVDKPRRVHCGDDERDYILASLEQVFPTIDIANNQIVFSFSGIRPLPKSNQSFTGRISRSHFVKTIRGDVPQFCMVGGKWTTFRAFAEEAADLVLAELGRDRLVSTREIAIGGGVGFEAGGKALQARLAQRFNLSRQRATHLISHYGCQAMEIAEFCDHHDQDRELGPITSYTRAEITWLIRHEQVVTLSDLVLRRTSLAITGSISAEIIDTIGALLSAERELSGDDITLQRDALAAELAEFHGVSLKTLQQRNTQGDLQWA